MCRELLLNFHLFRFVRCVALQKCDIVGVQFILYSCEGSLPIWRTRPVSWRCKPDQPSTISQSGKEPRERRLSWRDRVVLVKFRRSARDGKGCARYVHSVQHPLSSQCLSGKRTRLCVQKRNSPRRHDKVCLRFAQPQRCLILGSDRMSRVRGWRTPSQTLARFRFY